MVDEGGNIVTDSVGISGLFADFYEKLYSSTSAAVPIAIIGHTGIEAFTFAELQDTLRTMHRGRARDDNGIIVEMIREGPEVLLHAILQVFNTILTTGEIPPDSWFVSRIVVLFKKGDPTNVSNYRPISILSILYKVFNRMLCKRLSFFLVPQQSPEQAAYKKSFSVEDHRPFVDRTMQRMEQSFVAGLGGFHQGF